MVSGQPGVSKSSGAQQEVEEPRSREPARPESHAAWHGLTEEEVAARRARGLGNTAALESSRTYLQILRQNAFTFMNSVLFAIGIVLILMGRTGDAVVTAGLVLLNVVVGVAQEGRAKQKLDQIALLTHPRATVIRGGGEQSVDPTEIVQGDVLVARPGDQILVDGRVLNDGPADVDESLLTGESDPVSKRTEDRIFSGSFCVTGTVIYEAQTVGAGCLVYQMTEGARAFRQVKTPLQRDIDFIVRILTVLVTMLALLLILSLLVTPVPAVDAVQFAAVMATLVPQGLFFMIAITYAMGAVRMAGKGALVQQANAVESLSNVDVLCLDKTGTLTTNSLELREVHPLGSISGQELEESLGDFVASTSSPNRTSGAIGAALGGRARSIQEEVPFSSERKWSALAFAGDGEDDAMAEGVYVLGAPEVLRPHLDPETLADGQLDETVGNWAALGLRVLLFARLPHDSVERDAEGRPRLPHDLTPLGVLSLSDELRHEARTILKRFTDANIQLKLISGDSPQTVAALARQAGFQPDLQVVSADDLAGMDDEEIERVVEEATVFGRITPQQKSRLVKSLQRRGHYVAMVGDGVNDVLSLKQAQLGIAIQGGSQAARNVADVVLLNDSFAALPTALREGQRIANGMHDVVRLLLSRTFYVTLLILAASIIDLSFPLTPTYSSVQTLLTVGIPTLVLVTWARAGRPVMSLRRSVLHFVVPAACVVAAVSLAVYMLYSLVSEDIALARTALTTTMTLCGLMLIPFVEPPNEAWAGGEPLSGDRRPTFLALGLLAVYVVLMLVPVTREFFGLTMLGLPDTLLIAALVGVSGLLLRFVWRREFVEHLLGLPPASLHTSSRVS